VKSLWFVVPASGRFEVARVCLRQLARTCKTMTARGVQTSAVVIADDANLETAAELGFATVRRRNKPLGRKWNDGFQLAGESDVDYVVALGSDDWVVPELFLRDLPADGEMRGSRLSSVVSEDATRLARLKIPYDGGDGVRVYPTSLLKPLRYRPIEEDRDRAMDTSLLRGITTALGRRPLCRYVDLHPFQIVDWKTAENLNSYAACVGDRKFQAEEVGNPFSVLGEHYPREAIDEMRALYQAVAA
jgi:glycosyltransferase involved in cell wall biosynthesis